MKKCIVLAAVFVFVIGTISWTVYAPHTHTFENIPISIEYSWYIGEWSGFERYDQLHSGSEQLIPTIILMRAKY